MPPSEGAARALTRHGHWIGGIEVPPSAGGHFEDLDPDIMADSDDQELEDEANSRLRGSELGVVTRVLRGARTPVEARRLGASHSAWYTLGDLARATGAAATAGAAARRLIVGVAPAGDNALSWRADG
jgi:hypothetical protein